MQLNLIFENSKFQKFQGNDVDIIIKMFNNLPQKVIKAKNHGLDSLL